MMFETWKQDYAHGQDIQKKKIIDGVSYVS